MNKTSPIYDDTIQKQLDALICHLDENPYVCTNPVDDSSYLGFTLVDTDKGFMIYIKDTLYDKFLAYIDTYRKDCINSYAIKTHFVPVVKRLLEQYEEAQNNLYASDTRNQWAEYFNKSQILNAEQSQKKLAYQFFFKAAGVQIFFLGKLADKMKEYLAEFEHAIPKPDPEYFFSILPALLSKRHIILYNIHKDLKENGYTDCTPDAFKKVFTKKEPKPIRWLESQASLNYFIKKLTGRFLVKKNNPSNYYIAERYIHIYKNGKFLHPKKVRKDKDPCAEVTEFIDKVIGEAISTYK